MKTPDQIRVKIGKVYLTVPVCIDQETTLAIAQRISDELQRIEEQSDRIDTQAYALQAAYHFASQAERARREADLDTRETLVALDRLHESLKALIERSSPDTD